MEEVNLVDAALAGDKEAFMSAFNAAIATKVSDALEIKKVEVASTLITPEVEANEVQEIEAAVDGAESVDTVSDAAN